MDDLIVCQNYCNTMQVLNHQTLMHESWFTVSLINMLHASVKHDSMKHVLQWNMIHWNTWCSEPWFTETCDTVKHESLNHVNQWNMIHSWNRLKQWFIFFRMFQTWNTHMTFLGTGFYLYSNVVPRGYRSVVWSNVSSQECHTRVSGDELWNTNEFVIQQQKKISVKKYNHE